MTDRRRNTLVLLIVAGLRRWPRVAVIAVQAQDALGPGPEGRRASSSTRAGRRPQSKVDAESLERAIDIMRKRVDQLGVAQPEIQRTGANEIDVALPDVSNAQRAEERGRQDRAAVLLRLGAERDRPRRQAGADRTDGHRAAPNAGAAQYGLPEYQAVLRAAKRPAILRKNDTTCEHGLHPRAGGRLHLRQLVPARHQARKGALQRGPEETEQDLYADGYKPPAGSSAKAVRVNPGTVLVQARPVESDERQGHSSRSPNSWYVLNDDPVLEGNDITNPQQSFDEGAGGSGAAGRHLRLHLARGKTSSSG